jgi:hypothetical protein
MTCSHRDTFYIAGIAEKRGKFDGIYLGERRRGKLVYAGKVEHGFTDSRARRLKALAARFTTTRHRSQLIAHSQRRNGSRRDCALMLNSGARPARGCFGIRATRGCARMWTDLVLGDLQGPHALPLRIPTGGNRKVDDGGPGSKTGSMWWPGRLRKVREWPTTCPGYFNF